MGKLLPQPNVPFLVDSPSLVAPQWYEKLKHGFDNIGGGGASTFDQDTPFPVYTGGLARSIVDRSRDWIVATDFSDGSGTAANDLAALNAATAQCLTDLNKGILITRPFAPSGTWVIGPTGSPIAQGVRISGAGNTAVIRPGASMTNLIEISAYPFTIEGLNLRNGSGLAVNAIHVDKGNNTYICRIRNNLFESWLNVAGRCINTAYLNDCIHVEGNHANGCTFFWTLRGGNYECLGTKNTLNFCTYGLQVLRPSGQLQVEGLKYYRNTHLASTVSVYMAGSYMCWIDNNMFGSHRGSGHGIWMDSSSFANTSNQICGNFIGGEGYGNFGILVNGTGANCNDNQFIRNEISEWPVAGIAIAGSGNDSYLGQTVSDNTFRYVGTPSQACIVMVDTPGAMVKNNHCYTGGGTGINLSGTSTGSIHGNNVFRGGGLAVGGSGWTSEGANR